MERERGTRQRGREGGRVTVMEGERGRRACVEDVVLVLIYLQRCKRRSL